MEFIGDIARKRGDPDRLAVEAAKTTRAASVGAGSGRFHVPAVVRFDAAAGLLETERVSGFVSLMNLAMRRDARLTAICRRVGEAVAEVHAGMRLGPIRRVPIPGAMAGEPADECVVHGDLNGSNVGYDPSTDRVVIVDWAAAPSLSVAATVGSRYFDVLWFALFFFRSRPITALNGWSPERWAAAFLAGYGAATPAYSADALRAYHERAQPFLSQDYREERDRKGRGIRWLPYRVWQRLGWLRWERFLATLSTARATAGFPDPFVPTP